MVQLYIHRILMVVSVATLLAGALALFALVISMAIASTGGPNLISFFASIVGWGFGLAIGSIILDLPLLTNRTVREEWKSAFPWMNKGGK